MTAPLSLTKVRSALKRLYPPALSFQSDASSLGLERNSIGLALARACDVVESIFDEQFPDTALQLLDRWEQSFNVSSRSTDSLDTRRGRVIATLRRTSGPRIVQLEAMLSGPLALDPSDMVWVEQLREFIDEALTQTTGVVSLAVPATAPGLTLQLGQLWPGTVDDWGVHVYIAMSTAGNTIATLTSPDGQSWLIPTTGPTGWYRTRGTFLGRTAAGNWTLNIRDNLAPTLTTWKLLVSNNVDSGQIYNLFVLRDPTLAGTADLVEGQRLLRRTALANMRAFVVETLAFTLGDPHSLLGRDPLGV